MPRLGLIARCSATGLGNQTKDFYDHMKPDKTLVLDLPDRLGLKLHPEWYTEGQVKHVANLPTKQDLHAFLRGLDVVFTCESPYNYYLYQLASLWGVKTINAFNFEFLDHLADPSKPTPSILAAVSQWRIGDVQNALLRFRKPPKLVSLPVPVDRVKFPFSLKKSFTRFLHVVGRPAVHDRNGTYLLLEALKHLKTPGLTLVLYCQDPHFAKEIAGFAENQKNLAIELHGENIDDPAQMYADCDALVLPRKFGGLCLPMQEALSCGLPVIMPACDPNIHELPKEWLVEGNISGQFLARAVIGLYTVAPQDLAEKIDWFAQLPTEKAKDQSELANTLATAKSWESLMPLYREVVC